MPDVVMISGGTRGLGLCLVEGFLRHSDCLVATCGRSIGDRLPSLMSDQKYHDRLLFSEVDVRNSSELKRFADCVFQTYGRIDVLVNNAGIARDGVLATFSDADLDLVLDVDLKGLIRLTRSVCRLMLLNRSGRIINISSIVGLSGYNGLSAYSAAKAGVDGFTRSLARELGPAGIQVNSIAAGYLRTEMTHGLDDRQMSQIVRRTPMGRLGEPEDVRDLVFFLCSSGSSFITGHTFVVDGGLTA